MEQNSHSPSLLKATVFALAGAALLLIFFILPAEYNIDPTGMGGKLGLTALSSQHVATSSSQDIKTEAEMEVKTENFSITIPPKKGIEYKFLMQKYQTMYYEWITNGEPLYFDLHGEPEGDTTGYFESYAIATSNKMKGSFTTPFTGSHGWYWKNKSDEPIFVQLMVKGHYKVKP